MNPKISKKAILTICSNSYFAYARVLLSSVEQYHPEASLFLCLTDIKHSDISLGLNQVEIIEARELDIPDFLKFAFCYTATELSVTVKPFIIRYLIEKRGFEQVVYVCPNIELLAPITKVFDALDKGVDFVLTPTLATSVEKDVHYTNNFEIIKADVDNISFLAVNSSSIVVDFLHWWGRCWRFQYIGQQKTAIFITQNFIDLLLKQHDNVQFLSNYILKIYDMKQLETTSRPEHQAVKVDYAYGNFNNGIVITELIRNCYYTLEQFWVGNPFESFHEYLNEPYLHSSFSHIYPLTNLMYCLWKQRKDLQKSFNIDNLEGRKNYALWFIQNYEKLEINSYFVEPLVDEIAQLKAYDLQGCKTSSVSQGKTDVTIIGYLRSVIGIGHAGRMVLRSFQVGNLKTKGFNATLNVETRQGDCSVDTLLSPKIDGRIQVYNINADQLGLVRQSILEYVSPAEYIINMPFWELSKFPEAWLVNYENISEIWAPTRFIQITLQSVFKIPVFWMPPAVYVDNFVKLNREYFNLPKNNFLFHFNFDLSSFSSRKNPFAVIKAYRLAFRNNHSKVPTALVIKTRGYDPEGKNLKKLYESVQGESDIFIFNKLMTYQQTISLMNCCDCYVSLHRSEGFGYTLAEAMFLGKPVIATDYSGSKDFINSSTGFPVKYQMKSLNQDDYIFWEGQQWAEPDTEHAAWLMRKLIKDEFTTNIIALSGQYKILTDYSLKALGMRYLNRIQKIKNL